MNDGYLSVVSSSSTNSFPVAFKVVGALLSSLANGVAMSSAERARRSTLLQEQMRVCVAEYRIKKCGELTRTAFHIIKRAIPKRLKIRLWGKKERLRLWFLYGSR